MTAACRGGFSSASGARGRSGSVLAAWETSRRQFLCATQRGGSRAWVEVRLAPRLLVHEAWHEVHRSSRLRVDLGGGELEAFGLPALDAANHLLHRPSEPSEPKGCLVGAVAVWAIAVDDERRVRRELGEVALVDSAVREVTSAGHVASGEGVGAAHVEQRERGLAGLELLVDVPTVGLEAQQRLKVCRRVDRLGGGMLGPREAARKSGRHRSSLVV